MAYVPTALEILPKNWTAWVGRTSVTDDRRQRDGRAITYGESEREFTFAKNQTDVDRILHAAGPSQLANLYSQPLVIWPVKLVPDMTYNVFSGTLNPTQSINQSQPDLPTGVFHYQISQIWRFSKAFGSDNYRLALNGEKHIWQPCS